MNNQITESCGDVFKDFGFSSELSDKLTIKSCLMGEIDSYIKKKGITQDQAAKLMGVSRPRISDVIRGKIDKFTIDSLVDMLTKAGLHISLNVEDAA